MYLAGLKLLMLWKTLWKINKKTSLCGDAKGSFFVLFYTILLLGSILSRKLFMKSISISVRLSAKEIRTPKAMIAAMMAIRFVGLPK